MIETAVLAAFLAAGVTLAIQGALALTGRLRPRPVFIEQPLIEALSPKEEDVPRLLGRLRIVYGFFLIAVSLWALVI